jgi:hypothetical protein
MFIFVGPILFGVYKIIVVPVRQMAMLTCCVKRFLVQNV